MGRRIVLIFTIFMVMLTALYIRVSYISWDKELIEAGDEQNILTLEAYSMRANIYDRNFQKLVNEKEVYYALIIPSETSADFYEYFPPEKAEELSLLISRGMPFIYECSPEAENASGVTVYKGYERNNEEQLCSNLIGYLSETGDGVSGIEKAYNDYLRENGEVLKLSFMVNARGSLMGSKTAEIKKSGSGGAGVVLTIDKEIQKISEEAGSKIERGAVVVMDPFGGEILALASFPKLDVLNLSAALSDENSPFLNRAFSEYSPGSTFKLVVAAAALESGFSENEVIECLGEINLSGTSFRCHKEEGHGNLTIKSALENSCNPFFIELGKRVGFSLLYETAAKLGLGKGVDFGEGITSSAGHLPEKEEIKNPGDLANFSFGQGRLTVTPIQLAAVVSAVVNSGKAPVPRLIKGYASSDGKGFSEVFEGGGYTECFSASTANKLKEYMVSAVKNGTGILANPSRGAGGKTGSAETGQIGQSGTQIINAIFCGFYPAENPQYSIVVVCEDGVSGSVTAAPIFKEICEGIAALDG